MSSQPASLRAGSSRLRERFESLAAERRKALVGYLTAGDPAPEHTAAQMHALVRGGTDVIELGLPFTDPEAEGPAIQAACERALAAGTRTRDVLAALAAFRREDATTPVVIMGYLNSAEWWGYERFAAAVAEAGGDGGLFVNLPPEEADPVLDAFAAHGLDHIFLLAPTTRPERADYILSRCGGFAYYVSLKGTTGADHIDVEAVSQRLSALRAQSPVPVVVGFGIRTPQTAAALAPHADGVVIGSAIVECIGARGQEPATIGPALESLMRGFRQALDG